MQPNNPQPYNPQFRADADQHLGETVGALGTALGVGGILLHKKNPALFKLKTATLGEAALAKFASHFTPEDQALLFNDPHVRVETQGIEDELRRNVTLGAMAGGLAGHYLGNTHAARPWTGAAIGSAVGSGIGAVMTPLNTRMMSIYVNAQDRRNAPHRQLKA